ncbi:MAG: aminotransferase class III-fold pyridoxal phosphate-dependent enzyme [bacterium]
MKIKGDKSYIFHRRLDYAYPIITHGKGIYLYDEEGKRYIDACGGAIVANLGHGLKGIAREIGKLAARFNYLHGSQFTTRVMEDYARNLVKTAPKGLNKVFFVSGGSEAVESAIKLARQYHYDAGSKSKYKIICRQPAYHGSTILTLSLSSKPGMRKPQEPFILKFPTIPAPFCYRCPFGRAYPGCGLKCAKALEETIKKEGPETVCAFIAEPVIGASIGAVVPPFEYLSAVKKICAKYNVLLISDEVMSGFGRTGKWFASQHFNCAPDIAVIGKGIGGGFVPLAAVFCQEKILTTIKKGSGNFIHGFTFENNPFTTGVGQLVLRYVRKRQLVEKCAKMGKYLMTQLKTLDKISIVGDVRGLGLLTAVEFVQNKKTKKPFSRENHLAEKIVQAAMRKGLNLYFAVGFERGQGDAVMVAPPLTVTKKEIDKIVAIFKEAINEGASNS